MRYEPSAIEFKWQQIWAEQKKFQVSSDIEVLQIKPKYYILDMFPYPSGAGLHVGHPEGYTATDVMARLKRMQGFNVMHPMGWDAFGLPAERAAMRDNIHPAIITKRNITNFRRQIDRLGFSYDWNREINTTDPHYYKWTQWIFLQLYKRDLAYLAEVPVNWCPALGTVLANEEVKDGKYVETGDLVEKRLMKQWMLRITAYADRLLEDLDLLDWPDNVKEMQRNWIGKSDGLIFTAPVRDMHLSIETFSAHFESFAADTFVVIAPDHPLLESLIAGTEDAEKIRVFCQKLIAQRIDGFQDENSLDGIFTGRYIVDPVGNGDLPIWVASFALAQYGTGMVKCSAHDQRDFAFAKKFGIKLKPMLFPADAELRSQVEKTDLCYTDMLNGILAGPGAFAGRKAGDCREEIVAYCQAHGLATPKVMYKLRDWLFSRQRYWGEPVPVVYAADGRVEALAEELLPVELPPMELFSPGPDGQPPLANAPKEWRETVMSDGSLGLREINTMPQWAGSCWYYLRYLDPHNEKELCSAELQKYWLPVDLYIGGIEHAVLHLLYARFWHKVLFDCGVVQTKEPFHKLFNQGMILGQSYQDQAGKYYYPGEVEQKGPDYFVKSSGEKVKTQTEKMSKSRYNVISPDEVIDQYGADSMRLYEMFMGPLEQVKMWQMSGVEGVYRFLCRLWRLVVDEESGKLSEKLVNAVDAPAPDLEKMLHKTIKKVTDDTLSLNFNTAISQMMQFVNEATKAPSLPKGMIMEFLKVVSPYAPHVAEELWSRLGRADLIVDQQWPSYNEALCVDDQITVVVQVNGKRRGDLLVDLDESEAVVRKMAELLPYVQAQLAGHSVKKLIYVKNRLMNFVIG